MSATDDPFAFKLSQDSEGTKIARVMVEIVDFPPLPNPVFRIQGFKDGSDQPAFTITLHHLEDRKVKEILTRGRYVDYGFTDMAYYWEPRAIEYDKAAGERVRVELPALEPRVGEWRAAPPHKEPEKDLSSVANTIETMLERPRVEEEALKADPVFPVDSPSPVFEAKPRPPTEIPKADPVFPVVSHDRPDLREETPKPDAVLPVAPPRPISQPAPSPPPEKSSPPPPPEPRTSEPSAQPAEPPRRRGSPAKLSVTCATCGISDSFYSVISLNQFKARHRGHVVSDEGLVQESVPPYVPPSPPPAPPAPKGKAQERVEKTTAVKATTTVRPKPVKEPESQILVSKSWYIQGGEKNTKEAERISKILKTFRWKIEPAYTIGVILDDMLNIESSKNQISRGLIKAIEDAGYKLTAVVTEQGRLVAWFKKKHQLQDGSVQRGESAMGVVSSEQEKRPDAVDQDDESSVL